MYVNTVLIIENSIFEDIFLNSYNFITSNFENITIHNSVIRIINIENDGSFIDAEQLDTIYIKDSFFENINAYFNGSIIKVLNGGLEF
jgi:hypothetical protein